MAKDTAVREAKTTTEERVEALLAQMTLREKVSLLSGLNTWQTVPIERLGIPSLTMSDGPHGVRANRTGPERIDSPATSFPTGVSMAATWDPALIEEVGVALARETRALGCDILLGPCVNIMRTPLAGRNFEAYSEDPYLAGRIGVGWVKGLQSQRVGASLKHYACNNQGTERFRGNSVIDERTLREIYLAQFEAIVKETQPWTVMCSYNRINGVYASQNDHLQNEILHDEWGFEGCVISDWGANHTVFESVAGGLDIEMPGPARYYGDLLADAVRTWQIEESTIDDAVRRILHMIIRSGKMDAGTPEGTVPEGAVNVPEHQALARHVAEASMTLLTNEGRLLPLKNVTSIAVIGPNAAEARIGGGGSSYLEPPYRISPLEGLKGVFGDSVEIHYAQGCDNYADLPALKPTLAPEGHPAAGQGFWGAYYNNLSLEGEPAVEQLTPYLDDWWFHTPEGVAADTFSARWTGQFEVAEGGRYLFRLRTSGLCRLYLDGNLLIENTSAGLPEDHPIAETSVHVELEGGSVHQVMVEYIKSADMRWRELRVLMAYDPRPEDDDRIDRAVAHAKACDVAIIFAGVPMGFESEGHDRPHMKLPGRQDELIRAVNAANHKTVVVLNVGSPVEMPWANEVGALLLAYYPGQEGGAAVARVLTGAVNPSGKLPVTFPVRYEDNPSYPNFPGYREVHYGERLYVGYRYYDKTGVAPLFPFGFGLSYTTFDYRDLELPDRVSPGEGIEVALTVTNTGAVAGKEVVQLYVGDPASRLDRPAKELKRFAKVELAPGESKRLTFTLDKRALAFYDPVAQDWVAEPGEFQVLIGSSSRDIHLFGTFVLE